MRWLVVVWGMCISCLLVADVTPWTVCYMKNFNRPLANTLAFEKFEKDNVMPFSHLVVSFNASKPEVKGGYYRFFVQVRDKSSRRWLIKHKMFEWGNGVQRSFADKGRPDRYSHVRLDMHDGRLADGFRVLVEPVHGARLEDVKFLSVSVARLSAFRPERDYKRYAGCTSIYISGVPAISQMKIDHPHKAVICSPTSLGMVTAFAQGKHVINIGQFADGVYDKQLGIFGNWSLNTAHAFVECPQCHFYVQRLHSFAILYQLLRRGIPVVVSVRGKLHGAPKEYPSGHLLVVVGFDADKMCVICHDPAAQTEHEVEREYRLDTFLSGWSRSYNLSYVVEA